MGLTCHQKHYGISNHKTKPKKTIRGRKKSFLKKDGNCILTFCLCSVVKCSVGLPKKSREVPPAPPFILLSPSHLPPQLDVRAATTARRRPDHWGTTQSRVWACVETWKKHSFRLKEEVRLKEWLSGRETALMMLKIGPWLWYTPQVNHCYSLLSTYLSPCPPILPLPHRSAVSRRTPPRLSPCTHHSPWLNFFYDHLFKTSIFQPCSLCRHK